MDLDWGMLLARKYDLMQQEQNSRSLGLAAEANLNNVRAGLLPAESKANIDLTKANTGLSTARIGQTDAETSQIREQTKTIAPLAQASIFATRAGGRQYNAQAGVLEQSNMLSPYQLRGLGDNLGRTDLQPNTRLGWPVR